MGVFFETIGGSLVQWETGRQLQIVTTEDITEVHFAFAGDEEALVVEPKTGENIKSADVPNIHLQRSGRLEVYAVFNDGKTERTVGRGMLFVEPRPKPADYVYTETEVKSFEALEKQMAELKKQLEEKKATTAKIGEVTLLADAWEGEGYLFSQAVELEGVTENSQVDLTPSVEQLAAFYEKDLTFVTENDGGVVSVYAIGQKPQNDYSVQVTITEVEA